MFVRVNTISAYLRPELISAVKEVESQRQLTTLVQCWYFMYFYDDCDCVFDRKSIVILKILVDLGPKLISSIEE